MENSDELEEEQTKTWVPRVIQGGKEPPDPPVINWLETIPIDMLFLTKNNKETMLLHIWMVSDRRGRATQLTNPYNFAEQHWFDTLAFSKGNELFQKLENMYVFPQKGE